MNTEHLKKIDSIMDEMVDSGYAAGASTVVIENGREVYYGARGYRDIKNRKKVERDTIFRLYSLTKPVTGAAVMLLVQDGLLDLYAPVGEFLPSYREQTYSNRLGTYSVKRPMRIKDLLDMTSGLTYGCDLSHTEALTQKLVEEGVSRIGTDHEMSTREFAERLGEFSLLFSPGDCLKYSFSADVLGAVVEVVTGKRYGEFLKERIFDPCGMKDTGFFVPKEKRNRMTRVYKQTAEGLEEYTFNHLIINNAMDHAPAFESGGAGLCSTLDDYARFGQMLLNMGEIDGKRVMQEGTVRYFTSGDMQEPYKEFKHWKGMNGCAYANLLRVMKEPGKAITFASEGEYSGDGWLGPCLVNDPKHKISIVHMLQRVDSNTSSYMRRIRNVVGAAVSE